MSKVTDEQVEKMAERYQERVALGNPESYQTLVKIFTKLSRDYPDVTGLRVAELYLKRRDVRLRAAAELLDRTGPQKGLAGVGACVSRCGIRATGQSRTVDHSITNRELYH